jgi:hypothetical protein
MKARASAGFIGALAAESAGLPLPPQLTTKDPNPMARAKMA